MSVQNHSRQSHVRPNQSPPDQIPQGRTRWAAGAVAIVMLIGIAIVGPGCAPREPVADAAKAKTGDPLRGIDLYASGAQAYRRGDREMALAQLSQAVRLNPTLRMAQAMLGDLYRTKGDYKNAAIHYEKASQLDPYTLANHYNLGVMYQYLNRLKDAATAYLKALDLNPRDLKSNMNLGTVYLALGDTDEAVNYLERATMIDGSSGEAWSNLGVAYDKRGKTSLAEKAYRKALELDNSPVIMQNLGSNLIYQGRASEAVNVMKEVIARSNTPSAHKRYADALILSRQYDEALREYDTALKLDSKYVPAMNDKGFLLLKQYKAGLELDEDKLKEAVALWKVSLRVNPNQPKIEQALKDSEKGKMFGS
ncbi:MAG: tetratricopeptide repeat protein [Anaerolineae bacterium]|nr:tetratricopeptide repeat protein [Phycisphaerae bacterium]